MISVTICHKVRLLAAVVMMVLLECIAIPVQAVKLNFSAKLVPGTCSLSLDKSTLELGTVMQPSLQPATLLAVQPFTLTVQDCNGNQGTLLTPVVNVSGDGVNQDGRWLFRAQESTTNSVGVMLVKTNVPPSYGETEVKNGDDIPLSAKGVNPANQNLTFYAGITCGSSGCASPQAGVLTARILFSLAYR
ncbi:fimbrial protein [Serratia fonticola]|uniref:fimbrial protein n=1 Tax=Serratia fonticola TaxID=47917 RepID=UPI00192CFB41|nr:type 1 fimbrial protein [Serratia fonticola]MBL5825951.1 type 1 fimbrial protein [Serratia fonticola]